MREKLQHFLVMSGEERDLSFWERHTREMHLSLLARVPGLAALPPELLECIVMLGIMAERFEERRFDAYTRRSRRASRRWRRWCAVQHALVMVGEAAFRATLHPNSRSIPHINGPEPELFLVSREEFEYDNDSDAGADSQESTPPSPVYSNSGEE